MIGQIKVSSDRFSFVFVVFLYVAKVFSESISSSSPCFVNVELFTKSASYTVDGIG